MTNIDSLSSVADRIQQLMQQREQHVGALARIDQTLQQVQALLGPGSSSTLQVSRAPSWSKFKFPTKRRGRSGITGRESVLALIQSKGSATSQEIRERWESDGRKGRPLNLLGLLVQKKVLKRTPLNGQRGSTYSLVGSAVSPAKNAPTTGKRAGRKGKYGLTAGELILNFVGASSNPTTREIAQHWKREGRKGSADNALGILVKAKKLKRKKLEGQRGSTYSLA